MNFQQEQSWQQRTLVVIYLSTMTTGIGYLTLPQFAKNIGLFLTLIIVFAAGLAQMVSNYLLARLYNFHQINSYPAIVYTVLQSNKYYKSIIFVLALRSFGAIFIFIFFETLNILLFPSDIAYSHPYMIFIIKFVIALLCFALSLLNIRKTQYFSILGFISTLMFISALAFQKHIIQDDKIFMEQREGQAFNVGKNFNFWEVLELYGNAFYAFHIHDIFLNILQILEGESSKSTIGAALRSTYLPMIVYSFIIYFGYTSFFDQTPYLIFKRVSGSDQNIFNGLWIFLIIRIGLAINMIISLSTRIRSTFEGYYLWKRKDNKKLDIELLKDVTPKQEIICKIIITTLGYLMSLFITNTNICQFVNVVTCLFGPYYAIYMPCKLTLSQQKQLGIQNNKKQLIAIRVFQIFFVVLLLMCWIQSIVSLLNTLIRGL